jgi:hypothetical protein
MQEFLVMPSSTTRRRRQPVRTQQRRAVERSSAAGVPTERIPASRASSRRVAEPIDYAQDYAYVRQDLLRILIWGGLLFAGMVAVAFVI